MASSELSHGRLLVVEHNNDPNKKPQPEGLRFWQGLSLFRHARARSGPIGIEADFVELCQCLGCNEKSEAGVLGLVASYSTGPPSGAKAGS